MSLRGNPCFMLDFWVQLSKPLNKGVFARFGFGGAAYGLQSQSLCVNSFYQTSCSLAMVDLFELYIRLFKLIRTKAKRAALAHTPKVLKAKANTLKSLDSVVNIFGRSVGFVKPKAIEDVLSMLLECFCYRLHLRHTTGLTNAYPVAKSSAPVLGGALLIKKVIKRLQSSVGLSELLAFFKQVFNAVGERCLVRGQALLIQVHKMRFSHQEKLACPFEALLDITACFTLQPCANLVKCFGDASCDMKAVNTYLSAGKPSLGGVDEAPVHVTTKAINRFEFFFAELGKPRVKGLWPSVAQDINQYPALPINHAYAHLASVCVSLKLVYAKHLWYTCFWGLHGVEDLVCHVLAWPEASRDGYNRLTTHEFCAYGHDQIVCHMRAQRASYLIWLKPCTSTHGASVSSLSDPDRGPFRKSCWR